MWCCSVEDLTVPSHLHKKDAVHNVSFDVRAGEIVCIAGIDGNGQTELIHGLTGLDKSLRRQRHRSAATTSPTTSIHHRGEYMSHIPEDRHKHGLVLDFTLEQNLVLQRYQEPRFENGGLHQAGRRPQLRPAADREIRRPQRSGPHHRGPQYVRRQPAEGHHRP